MSQEVSIIDKASPELRRRMAALSPQRLNAAIGPACLRLTQSRLRGQGTNQRGFHSTQFWLQAADSASQHADADGTTIRVQKIGARLQFDGGTVVPVNKKYLTIPATDEAYGHRALEFSGLVVFWGKDKEGRIRPMGLKTDEGVERRGARPGGKADRALKQLQIGTVMFWFVTETNHLPHPNVLPSSDEYFDVVKTAVNMALK